ncbi:alpha/beta hydrolase [Magnetovibrio sp.]|uniref:alpha/beta hydrolase n=1 Tax=Magnetovibrio sp. TaxID=2024836 RepID=UPI002F956FCC
MSIDPVQEQRFNVRAAVPDHLAIFAQWRAMSDAYKAACTDAKLDQAYGDAPSETLDFFPAMGAHAPTPVVLLIHGGYWQALDKADNAFAARAFNAAGIGVAVVNHTLCPDISLDGITDQIRQASLWLWRNADALGCDPDRMFVVGHSAGGHLAAMMMCTDWRAIDAQAPVDLFKGGVAISGLFDLTQLVETTINAKVGLDRQSAMVLSPMRLIPSSTAPFIAAVGGAESDGFHEQSDRLRDAWGDHGVTVERLTVPGGHHFQAFEALLDPRAPVFEKTLLLMS